ncbi:uncharacterized protein LOC132553367 [Ylistrum balloti]|uniref:uncharacterized protein LOC132553367 n=1 Tax=Ylistrum balloti TaxID=509963 RepID=UPI002905ABEF|nr:uncharacterized protein LOC132553367 [Ylistrum balloti]
MAESTISPHKVIASRYFDHIKWGGPCPQLSVNLAEEVFVEKDLERMSLLLTRIIDDIYGTEEMVQKRRKEWLFATSIENVKTNDAILILAGSRGDGFSIYSADTDMMCIIPNIVAVADFDLYHNPSDSVNKTLLLTKEIDCRPGYVALEVVQISDDLSTDFLAALVPVGDSIFLSSDIFREEFIDTYIQKSLYSNGPCVTYTSTHESIDVAFAIPLAHWPKEGEEWKNRTRFHGWPTQSITDRIVREGCHLVPVGDKCSTDTLLQWRISFVYAEQILVRSFTHSQFRIYGLLKHFLNQIKGLLVHITGDDDILCSYFLKSIIFYAVENTTSSLWTEKNTLICIRFCLAVLIAWVKAGYCPNYFVQNNNLFQRKVVGENRQKLLHFLMDCYDLNWPRTSLSVESVKLLDLETLLLKDQERSRRQYRECETDSDVFLRRLSSFSSEYTDLKRLGVYFQGLTVSGTDVAEFIAYYAVVTRLCSLASTPLKEYNTSSINKQKYRAMKKAKHLLVPKASFCTSPGLLLLATFHFLIGDYRKALLMSADVISTSKVYADKGTQECEEKCQRLNPGLETTLYQKMRSCVYPSEEFTKKNIALCLPHLHLEITRCKSSLQIPPLAYATFLSFLCHHELGNSRRRDIELHNLQAASHDPEQGGHRNWIVHTILGISFQIVGDKHMAIRSFTDSLEVMPDSNPAKERLEALRNNY